MSKKLTEFQKGVKALAKAIREARPKVKQTKGDYVYYDGEKGGKPAACALGAAWIDGRPSKEFKTDEANLVGFDDVAAEYPIIRARSSEKDMYGLGEALGSHIICLNDENGWSLTKIAKWLDKLAKLPAPPKRWEDV